MDRCNAKVIIATYRQAMMAGTSFTASSRNVLICGLAQVVRPAGIFHDRVFSVTGLDKEALSGATRHPTIVRYGSPEFDPEEDQPRM